MAKDIITGDERALLPHPPITMNKDGSSFCNKFTIFCERIHRLVSQDPSLAGPLVRLAFHDATTRDVGNSGGPN